MHSKHAAVTRTLIAATGLALGAGLLPTLSLAQSLPEPYVSRALDAVLLPIDAAVVTAFSLDAGTKGALILATQPGGLAEAAGFLPGDVIETIKNKKVKSPIEVDEIVLYWIMNGVTDFGFDIWRNGALATSSWVITEEYYYETIDVTSVSSWSSYSSETFSYESYYSEYSESIVESYEYSETLIEETVTSEEFTSEVSEESSTEENMTEETSTEDDADGDGVADDAEADDGGDAGGDDAGGDDSVDEGSDDAGGDDGGDAGGDDAGGDDGGDEGSDDAGGDDGGDAGGDDAGGDDGGDAGGDDGGDSEG